VFVVCLFVIAKERRGRSKNKNKKKKEKKKKKEDGLYLVVAFVCVNVLLFFVTSMLFTELQ